MEIVTKVKGPVSVCQIPTAKNNLPAIERVNCNTESGKDNLNRLDIRDPLALPLHTKLIECHRVKLR